MNSDKPNAPARICVCVDDFGLGNGVNEAVLRLAARGRVHATSCMVFGPAWPAGASALAQLDGEKLDVGLHLDFTQYPSHPSRRQTLSSLILRSALGLLDTAAVRAEIRAQLDAFERAMGRPPACVDGHQHVHQLRGIRDVLVDELQQRYGTSPPWIRLSSGLPLHEGARVTGWPDAVKSCVIGGLGATPLTRLLHAHRMRGNHRLLGVYGFSHDPATYEHLLASWMSIAADADLLMCHPGTQGVQQGDPIAAARLAEFAVLDGDAFESIVATSAVKLMPMSQILRARH